MEKLTAKKIAKMSGGKIISGSEKTIAGDVSIDSRETKKGDLFVALKGEYTDGHRFLGKAYEAGARVFLVSDEELTAEFGQDLFKDKEAAIILVEDSLRGLQELSANYLLDMDMKTIAVTGSVGKTTTRDMLFAAIGEKYKAGTNKKNYNSETGLPLTLLSFTKDLEVGVLEMGMDAAGQISRLAEISNPDGAVITNIGVSHIERLGSRENIMAAKMEVVNNFDSDSVLVVNWDDDMLSELREELLPYTLVKVGSGKDCDYRINSIKDLGIEGISFELFHEGEKRTITLPVPGSHNAINCALAIAGAGVMGVSIDESVKGIKKMKMTGSRLRVVEVGGLKIIDDSYNAAPSSMKSALDTLSHTKAKRKVAVLGGINELGKISEKEHRGIGAFAKECDFDLLITVGEMAKWIGSEVKSKIKVLEFEAKEDIYPEIRNLFKKGDTILVKASRSYELDKLVEEITNSFK